MPEEPERSKEIERLIQPRGESGEYSEDMRDLLHAREILDKLRKEVTSGPRIAWKKLFDARDYIDDLIKKHLEEGKDK